MSRNLSILLQPLTAGEEVGLGALDDRLSAIVAQAELRNFSKAADLVEPLFEENIFDMRPISIYLFQAFMEQGFFVLKDILDCLILSLTQNKPAIGPIKRQDDQFLRRLHWLFQTMFDALQYHSTHGTDIWAQWQHNLTPDVLEESISKSRELSELLVDGLKDAKEPLGLVTQWLRGHHEAVQVKFAPPPAAEQPKQGPAIAEPPPGASLESLEMVRRRVDLVVSHAFIELWCKLKAFETLIEKGQFERAALVADDVQTLMDSFDPRVYLPEIFGRYSALLSKHIDTMAGHWADRDSTSWKALSQYYKVDPKGFVDG